MDFIRQIRLFGRHLCRMPRTRGFGVQSPTAYSFLRNVVNESHFLSCHASDAELISSYPRRASSRERFLHRMRQCYPRMRVLDLRKGSDASCLESVVDSAASDLVLVVLNPDADSEAAGKWKALVGDRRCILTFDMIDCGVVFFDPTKFKQHFKVNYGF